jgi:hypothetical protein
MKRAIIVANERAEHQQSWGAAFAHGLRLCGWQVSMQRSPAPCDMLVLWGTRNRHAIDAQKRAGGEVCILERGYLGDRFAWTSVSFGGLLNGRATFRGQFGDASRWERHFTPLMKPWRENRDGYALLIGQVPGDQSIAGADIGRWYSETAGELKRLGHDVRFRRHPVAVQRGHRCSVPGVPIVEGDLAEAIAGATVVVTFNSNTAVEAVLVGVPTISIDPGSMAWDVTSHNLAEIVTPDRTAWAWALAWKQWRREEMESGFCHEAVGLA